MNETTPPRASFQDKILFSLLVGAYLAMRFILPLPQFEVLRPWYDAFLPLMIGFYWLLDLLPSVTIKEQRRIILAKFTIITVTITILVLAPSIIAISWRAQTSPHLFVHDGLIQSEAATDFVLAAKNPYVENYINTPMALWPFQEGELITQGSLLLLFLIITCHVFYAILGCIQLPSSTSLSFFGAKL